MTFRRRFARLFLSEGEKMPYTAASIANGFLSRSFQDKKHISPMKIQKLVYIAHGYSLVECDEPMLNEVFEAWKFGPVLSSLYHECKRFSSLSIPNYVKDIDPMTGRKSAAPLPSDPRVNDLIDFVWRTYGNKHAVALSSWTHVRGGPWDRVTNGGSRIIRHQDVPNEFIEEYFRNNMYVKEA